MGSKCNPQFVFWRPHLTHFNDFRQRWQVHLQGSDGGTDNKEAQEPCDFQPEGRAQRVPHTQMKLLRRRDYLIFA